MRIMIPFPAIGIEGAQWCRRCTLIGGGSEGNRCFVAQFAQCKETGLMIEKNSEET